MFKYVEMHLHVIPYLMTGLVRETAAAAAKKNKINMTPE